MTTKNKIFTTISLVLVSIFLVSGIVTAIIFNSINANSRKQVMSYYKNQLSHYEKIAKDSEKEKYTISSVLSHTSDLYSNDYLMNIYSETGVVNVQMKNNSLGKLYLIEFKDTSIMEFYNKNYVLQLGSNNSFQSIYEIENGAIVQTYKSTEAAFFNLCDKLQKYLPDNYCAKKSYINFKVYSDSSTTTYIVYGDNATLLYNKNYYFEEDGNTLIRIKANNGKYIFKIPKDIR